jgi:hypothetical protein
MDKGTCLNIPSDNVTDQGAQGVPEAVPESVAEHLFLHKHALACLLLWFKEAHTKKLVRGISPQSCPLVVAILQTAGCRLRATG